MTSRPADQGEQLLALNERMNALETEVQGVLAQMRAFLASPPEGRRGPRGKPGERGLAPDLAPLEARVEAALGDMRAQVQGLAVQALNTTNELEARAQRAITAVNLITRKEGQIESES